MTNFKPDVCYESPNQTKINNSSKDYIKENIRKIHNLSGSIMDSLNELTSYQNIESVLIQTQEKALQIEKNVLLCADKIPTSCLENSISIFPVKITKEWNLIHIHFSELLPHRVKYNFTSKKIQYHFDYSYYANSFRTAAQEYIKDHGIQIYNKKCLAYIRTSYTDSEHTFDHDNLEPKPLIDHAIKPFLIDDNVAYLSLYFDAEESSSNYTDVWFGPEEDVLKLICNFKRT